MPASGLVHGSGTGSTTASGKPAKKLQVDDFLITGGKINVSLKGTGGFAAPIALPDIHFTVCSADDINARVQPALETDGHELYLVSGASGHCLEITSDFEGATGIVVAAKADE